MADPMLTTPMWARDGSPRRPPYEAREFVRYFGAVGPWSDFRMACDIARRQWGKACCRCPFDRYSRRSVIEIDSEGVSLTMRDRTKVSESRCSRAGLPPSKPPGCRSSSIMSAAWAKNPSPVRAAGSRGAFGESAPR